MRVKWLRNALLNLDEEAAYIAADNQEAARLAVQRIVDSAAMLASQPSMGRPGRVIGTRELLVPKTRYLIPYRIRAEQVEILRVFHTSRKPPKRW
ncbi:MAG: type II toxin-antitoxin system RelE/ParE family toxin [Methylophilaceae bacterium]